MIAVIACVTVEEVELAKNIFRHLGDWLKEQYEKVKAWLQKHQYWDILVSTLKSSGRDAAKALCLQVIDEDNCNRLLDKMSG